MITPTPKPIHPKCNNCTKCENKCSTTTSQLPRDKLRKIKRKKSWRHTLHVLITSN